MIGSQNPRICVEPARVTTDGNDAAQLMAAYSIPLADWQQLILDCWLGKDAAGHYTATNAGLSAPRQNGKNTILEAREFFGLVVRGERILHTAHMVVTAKKSFRRLEQMFSDPRHPEVQKLVKGIRYTNGEEAIELTNGGSIEFSARSRQRARGFAGISLVVFDEAQELTDDQMDAILPILSASATGTRQIIYTGTPPYPGCPGEVFRRRRRACLDDPGPHDTWHEWSIKADRLEDIQLDDVALWYATNPAMGINLDEGFTRNELKTLSADGFARERLGWWAPTVSEVNEKMIDPIAWEACKSEDLRPEGKTAYGVKFSADGALVVLAGAVIPKAGPARISLIDQQPTARGLSWLAEWLNARYKKAACVVIDGRNGSDFLIEKIRPVWRIETSVIKPRAQDVVHAATMLLNDVNERALTWYFGQAALNDSALQAEKRNISGGFGFGGQGSELIEACSLALWGARTSKRDPTRQMRIG